MAEPISIPADVQVAIRARWPALAEPWSTSVIAEFYELCDRYDAEPATVLPARFGLVVKVIAPGGPLILKSSPDPNGRHQGTVSRAFAELGMSPQVHEFTTTEHGSWTVMDMIEPGIPLGEQKDLPPPEHVAAMLAPLISQPAPAPDLPSLVDWLRDRLANDHIRDLAPGHQVAAKDERTEALAILDLLAADHIAGLCHADASPWNVLTGKNERLYLIDPRGVSGEPSYDVAVISLKASARVPVEHSVSILCDALALDKERALDWAKVAAAARV